MIFSLFLFINYYFIFHDNIVFFIIFYFINVASDYLIVYNLHNEEVGSGSSVNEFKEWDRIEMEVDLRERKISGGYLYFCIKDRWNEIFFSKLPKNVKFVVWTLFICCFSKG